jgi:hypothetical protein
MVDKAVNQILENTLKTNKDVNQALDENKVKKIESRLNSLLSDRNIMNPAEAMSLRQEASALDKLAVVAEELAQKIEQGEKSKEKKSIDEIKKAMLDKLGIPPEFVDQLSILVKGGPEALREAAGVYREAAQKKRAEADFLTVETERLDKEIKNLTHLKSKILESNSNGKTSMQDYLAQIKYQESLRDKADLVLKTVLEQIENGVQGEKIERQ